MKISEYNEMMAYLTRRKPKPPIVKKDPIIPKKEVKREENMLERTNRVLWEHGETKEKPKHLDNKNIYTHEDKPKQKPIVKIPKKPEKEFKINTDLSSITTNINLMDDLMTPTPKYEPPKPEKLEGIETILGIKK